jgi:hypothetical protein
VIEILQGIYVLLVGSGGIFCFLFAWKCWLQFLRPPPRLELRPGAITLGEPFAVAWQFPDAKAQREPARFWLEGREEAKVLHWVNTGHGEMKEEKDERATFARLPIAESQANAAGEGRAVMPAATMHSFSGRKTKIRWVLHAERRPQGGERSITSFRWKSVRKRPHEYFANPLRE